MASWGGVRRGRARNGYPGRGLARRGSAGRVPSWLPEEWLGMYGCGAVSRGSQRLGEARLPEDGQGMEGLGPAVLGWARQVVARLPFNAAELTAGHPATTPIHTVTVRLTPARAARRVPLDRLDPTGEHLALPAQREDTLNDPHVIGPRVRVPVEANGVTLERSPHKLAVLRRPRLEVPDRRATTERHTHL